MSYFSLKSKPYTYFGMTNMLYPHTKEKKILFGKGISLEDVSDEWVESLSAEDKKLLAKDLKKIKKL